VKILYQPDKTTHGFVNPWEGKTSHGFGKQAMDLKNKMVYQII
jgi:hypothetical protein